MIAAAYVAGLATAMVALPAAIMVSALIALLSRVPRGSPKGRRVWPG